MAHLVQREHYESHKISHTTVSHLDFAFVPKSLQACGKNRKNRGPTHVAMDATTGMPRPDLLRMPHVGSQGGRSGWRAASGFCPNCRALATHVYCTGKCPMVPKLEAYIGILDRLRLTAFNVFHLRFSRGIHGKRADAKRCQHQFVPDCFYGSMRIQGDCVGLRGIVYRCATFAPFCPILCLMAAPYMAPTAKLKKAKPQVV